MPLWGLLQKKWRGASTGKTTAHKGEWEPAQTGKVWEQQERPTKILGPTTAQRWEANCPITVIT